MRTSLILIPTLALLNWGIISTAAPVPIGPSISEWKNDLASNGTSNATSGNPNDLYSRSHRIPSLTPRFLDGRQLHNADYGAGSGNEVPSSTETDSSFETEPTSAPPPATATSPTRRSLAVDNTRRRSRLKYKIIPPLAVGEDDAGEEPDYEYENTNARRTSREDNTIRYWGWSRDIVPATVHGGTDGDTEETNEEVQDAAGGFPSAPGPSPRALLMNGCGASSSSEYMAQRRAAVSSDRECQPDDIY